MEGSYAHPYLPKPDGKRLRYEDLVADDAGLVALPVEANVKRVAQVRSFISDGLWDFRR